MVECRHTLQFTEHRVLVGEKVSNELVAVPFLQGKGCLGAGTEDAWGEGGGKGRDIVFISGSEVDKASEMVHASIQRGDIGEAKLRESLLEDGDPRSFGAFSRRTAVNGADNFIYV